MTPLKAVKVLATASLILAATMARAQSPEGMAHWNKATEALKGNHYGAALPELDAALAAFPNNPVVLATRGDIHLRMGHFEAALADLGAAIRSAGETKVAARPLYQRAGLIMAKQPDVARRDIEHAVALDPDDSDAHYMLAASLRREDPVRALAEIDRAVALHPAPAIYRELRGMLRQEGGDLAGAKADLDLAVERDPKNFLVWSARASVNLERGDCRAARSDASQAQVLYKNHPLDSVTEALADVFLDDIAAAARLLREVAQHAPEEIAERAWLGAATPDALLSRIDRDAGRSPRAQLAWGMVAAARGDSATARQHFDQALKGDARLADQVHLARRLFEL